MPIRRGQVVVTPPTDTPGVPTEPQPRVRDSPRALWIAPDGEEVPLTSPEMGWKTLHGVKGLGSLPVTLNTDKLPGGGARVRNVRREHREFDWPVRYYGRNHTEFLERKHYLIDKFTQTDELGPGTLVVTRPDGSTRQIGAYYVEGLEGDEDGWLAESAVITFLAEEPWWTGPAEVSDEIVQQSDNGSYLGVVGKGFPNVSSSKTLGDTTVLNPGQLTTPVTWTFTGPASLITVTHDTTGKSFTLNPNYAGHGNLLAGETITVQTDPMKITGPDGSAWTGALNWPGASLFPLLRGNNKINFVLSGAVTGTKVSWRFAPRYRSA